MAESGDEKRALIGNPPGATPSPRYTDLEDSTSLSFFRARRGLRGSGRSGITLLHEFLEKIEYFWRFIVKKAYLRECFAEFFGTFFLVGIGNGAVAQASLGSFVGGPAVTFQSINVGYALALVIGVYVSAGVSGGHLNPAVTFAMALLGNTSWLMVIPYWIAQLLGAFVSSVFVYGVYADAINVVGKNITTIGGKTTAGIFATYPAGYLTIGDGFFDQAFGTFILMVGILAVCDKKNSEVLSGLKPFMIGIILWAIGSSFGMNAGYAINPARDFGPRLFTAMAGWGEEVFVCKYFCGSSITHWWWVPIIAPMFGAMFGAFFYWFFISAHHPKEKESSDVSNPDDVDDDDDEEKEPINNC